MLKVADKLPKMMLLMLLNAIGKIIYIYIHTYSMELSKIFFLDLIGEREAQKRQQRKYSPSHAL